MRQREALHRQEARAIYAALLRPAALVMAVLFLLSGIWGMSTLRGNMQESASAMATAVSSELRSVEKQCFMLASLSTVSNILPLQAPTYRMWIALDSDIQPFTASQGVRGVEIVMLNSRRVLVADYGLSDLAEYPDPAFLQQLATVNAQNGWIRRIYRKGLYGAETPVLTCWYALPLYETRAKGFALISYAESELQARAAAAKEELPGTGGVRVGEILLYADGDMPGSGLSVTAEVTSEGQVTAWRSMEWWRFALLSFRPGWWLLGMALLALVLWPAALVIYRRIHAPVRALAERFVGQMLEDGAMDAEQIGEEDLLWQAFDSLSEQLRHAQRAMEESRPLLQEQVTGRLLFTAADPADMQAELRSASMELPYPWFAVIALDCEAAGEAPQRRIVLRRNAEELFSSEGKVYSATGAEGTVFFLLNCERDENLQERLTGLCRNLQSATEGMLGFRPGFSISICGGTSPSLYSACMQAREGLPLTRGSNGEESVAVALQAGYTPMVDAGTVRELADAVLARDAQRADELLSEAFVAFFPADMPADAAGRVSSAFACALYGRLTEIGGEADASSLATALRRVANADSTAGCGEELRAWVQSLFGERKEQPGSSALAYVRKAQEYIEGHYAECTGVSDIAACVYLNPVYLNRIFKDATGTTLSEALNAKRIERSLPLLAEGLPVGEIATAVGFSESRVYIRHFRKIYGMTPGEYRKAAAQTN